MTAYLIGIDFGSESARGVRIDLATGRQEASRVHAYRHGIVTGALGGRALPPGFALQVPADYLAAAEDILTHLGQGREIAGIGIDFTASSPLPARADGTALADLHPDAPHAQVKLWKHSAQAQADAINARGGAFLAPFGGRVSGEWLLAKAAETASAAPELWDETERFIEAGDWLVWQLTGEEARSLDFAAYKAQYSAEAGYPEGVVPGLAARLAPPRPVGSPAGALTPDWRRRTGIVGAATVAVAAIDSHGVLPAVGAVAPGLFVGALGTSAGFLVLDGTARGLPPGLEGAAFGAALPDLWCHEAGQAAFGDMLAWYVRAFPRDGDLSRNFALHNAAAASVPPGSDGLIALDWFAGNRVPLADSRLSGLVLGLSLKTRPEAIYRALIEALCHGTRAILDTALAGGVPIERVIMTSGLTRSNPLLVQILADTLDRPVEVPEIDNPTAVGAAIHGAVACGAVAGFAAGAARFGARDCLIYRPDAGRAALHDRLYDQYRRLAADTALRESMHALQAFRP
ncbi:ribulokinase [Aureimonas endophytica]|uniref:Ribulokinase n=1 Tax=Aureimonas endophytica TaxID=2027858 RepID=A0A916ZS18_9HYPH|nr:FGGY-family carbohydrate kinase [Aureimonas endophytica]GGE11441.1 ribulokinase [Aureimonas endophytica]